MPVYEGEKFLSETLECILNQSLKNFELIILDNQSEDKSAEIIKSYCRSDDRIKYIYDKKKRNGNDCFSELIKYANGKYLIVLNDDNFFDNNFFQKLLLQIQSNQYDLVTTNGWLVNEYKKKLRIFFKNKSYFEGSPSLIKIIRFFYNRADVIPLLLPTIINVDLYKKLLPYENLSKFENDADTLMGIKILSNLKIKTINEELFYCRIYPDHQRFHKFQIPKSFIQYYLEKIRHDKNLIFKTIQSIYYSKLSFYSKFLLVLIFPFLVYIKRLKDFLIKLLSIIKNFLLLTKNLND